MHAQSLHMVVGTHEANRVEFMSRHNIGEKMNMVNFEEARCLCPGTTGSVLQLPRDIQSMLFVLPCTTSTGRRHNRMLADHGREHVRTAFQPSPFCHSLRLTAMASEVTIEPCKLGCSSKIIDASRTKNIFPN